jgi:hypothetical protein
MTIDERAEAMCFWNSIVVGVALYYFGNTWWMALCVAFIVLISALIGYGRRHLMRLGFATMVFTLAVMSGAFPHPSLWGGMLKSAHTTMSDIQKNGHFVSLK